MFNTLTPTNIVELVIALLISMTVHEFMHGYVGYLLGDTTAEEKGRLSLNPLRHIDPFMTIILPIVTIVLFHIPILAARPVPFNPNRVKYGEYGAAMLAAAGPLSNLVLAIIAIALLKYVNIGPFMGNAVAIFLQLNVVLFVFNLVPIPPLDGSRILYAFAPEGVQEVMQKIEPFGFFIVITLVLLGGFNLLTSVYSLVLNGLTHI